MRKEIGKIKSVSFGFGGYQDAQFGITIDMGSSGWGVTHFDGFWSTKRDKYCTWTEKDRIDHLGKLSMNIAEILRQANKTDVYKLVGVPVEVTFDGTLLKEWRVLVEAI